MSLKSDSFDYVVVDCSNLAYRNWWRNRFRKTSKDIFCGLEFGFIQAIMVIARSWYPARVVLVWDGEPVRGLRIFPRVKDEITGKLTGYKSDREEPRDRKEEPDWDIRLDNLRERFKILVPTLYHKDNEADEQLSLFIKEAESRSFTTIIISNDEDLHQLVSDYTYILRFGRSYDEEAKIWGVPEIKSHWGVDPDQLPLRWAIESDGARNGIPRIRKSVIVDLVSRCSTLKELFELIDVGINSLTELELEKLRAGKDIIQRNYELLNLLGLEDKLSIIKGTVGDSSGVKKLCTILEISQLVNRREWDLLEESGKLPLFDEGDIDGEETFPTSRSRDPG